MDVDPPGAESGTQDGAARERLGAIAAALGIGGLERHVFLCAEQTKPRCSTFQESSAVWRHLKSRLKELGLASAPPEWIGVDPDDPPPSDPEAAASLGRVLRTKADCLRFCEHGPIAVVYPDGTWYHSVDVETMERIIVDHLVEGRPVLDHVISVDRLEARS